MPAVVLLIIILLVAFLVLKSVHDARQRATGHAAGAADPSSGGHPSRTQRRDSRREDRRSDAAPPIDEQALSAHVGKLREAVAQGLISADEAAASVVRQSHGHLSDQAARDLLDADDEAA